MKIQFIVCSAMAAALLTGCATEHYEHHHRECRRCEKCGMHEHHSKHAWEKKLIREAKVNQKTAEHIALAKVPDRKIKDGELEKENGRLQWSFDLTTPDSKDITEVNIDAKTGVVISVQKESPESETREADEGDAKSMHGDKGGDND